MKQKIFPFLWFDDQAYEAAKFYTSVFKATKITDVQKHGKKVFSVNFKIGNQEFYCLNGGPHYQMTPAISLFVDCKDQSEVDRIWNKLAKGGKELRCGWITDKFGLTWQIIPVALGKLLGDRDREKAGRVMDAMMKMVKIDVQKLKDAHRGK